MDVQYAKEGSDLSLAHEFLTAWEANDVTTLRRMMKDGYFSDDADGGNFVDNKTAKLTLQKWLSRSIVHGSSKEVVLFLEEGKADPNFSQEDENIGNALELVVNVYEHSGYFDGRLRKIALSLVEHGARITRTALLGAVGMASDGYKAAFRLFVDAIRQAGRTYKDLVDELVSETLVVGAEPDFDGSVRCTRWVRDTLDDLLEDIS